MVCWFYSVILSPNPDANFFFWSNLACGCWDIPANHRGWAGANGSRIPHTGFVTTPCRTKEGDSKIITWKNADVDLPILSTHELAKNGHCLEYDEDAGVIRNKTTGKTNGFISQGDVYWIALLVPKSIAGNKPQGFGRPG